MKIKNKKSEGGGDDARGCSMITVVLSCMCFMCFMCFMCLARSRLACAGAQVYQTHVRACVYTDTCACMCIHRHMCVHVRTQTHLRAFIHVRSMHVCTRNGAHLHSTTALRTHPVRREAHKLPNVIQLAVACACTHAYIHGCEQIFEISRCGAP